MSWESPTYTQIQNESFSNIMKIIWELFQTLKKRTTKIEFYSVELYSSVTCNQHNWGQKLLNLLYDNGNNNLIIE